MPRIIVQALEGRSQQQKRALVKSVTAAVVEAFEVDANTVTIVLEDIPKANFGKAGVLASDRVESRG